MDAFKTITTRHLELLSQQQEPPENFLDVVKQFREEIFQSGRDTFAPAERDQLRSILRYWTNTINQNSAEKIYEVRDLDEFQGQPKGRAPSRRLWLTGGVLVAILVVSISLFRSIYLPRLVALNATITQVAYALQTNQMLLTRTVEAISGSTSTPSPSETAVFVKAPPSITVLNVIPDQAITIQGDNFLPNETFLATMVLKETAGTKEVVVGSLETGEGGSLTISFPIPSELRGAGQLTLRLESKGSGLATTASFDNSPTSTSLGSSAEFDSSLNGQFITPNQVFKGTYTNLRQGWIIYLTFKSTSTGSRIFPVGESDPVQNAPNGDWDIKVDLGAQFDLSKPDEYVADLVIANTESIRTALQSGVDQGFTELPPEAIVMNKPIVVRRQAYKTINEERILYSVGLNNENNRELFSARLDGSDITQITYTPDSVEDSPSLSTDGKKIAFADTKNHSIWIMDSNGENREVVYSAPERLLEGPVFSPDGRYLAFTASEPDNPSERTTYNIYVIDLIKKGEPLVLTKNQDLGGKYLSNRWPFWLDNKSLIYSGFKLQNEFVYQVNLGTTEPELYYGNEPVYIAPRIQMPVFYPTNMLAFASPLQTDVLEINVAVYPDGKPRQLTNNRYSAQHPRWSLDGQWIFYDSNAEIWAVNVDGSNAHQVIEGKTLSATWPWVGEMVAYFLLQP